MGEKEVIENTRTPSTYETLLKDFKGIGIKKGMILLVHSSLSSIGWVNSGPAAVILALLDTLGDEGTLVMPAHSGDLSDPSKWENPPVPSEWIDTVKKTMLPFYPDMTPTRGLGIIPEVFRKIDGVLRSDHPQMSFAAKGRLAANITKDHSLSFGLGMDSPLGKIYSLGGYVLMIGTGHDTNTSLHLAEYLSDFPGKKIRKNIAPILEDGKRVWVESDDLEDMTEDFDKAGDAFLLSKKELATIKNIGQARSQLFRQKDLVDFAIDWFKENR